LPTLGPHPSQTYSFGFYIISKKKIFQNFQKIELLSPIKGSRIIFEQKHFGIPPYYNPRAIQKKKKLKFSPSVFFLLTVDLKLLLP